MAGFRCARHFSRETNSLGIGSSVDHSTSLNEPSFLLTPEWDAFHMTEIWANWKQSCKSLAERIKSDPESLILAAGAEFYAVKNPGEAWFGWRHGSGDKHKCIGIIREAKEKDGIWLLLHLDPKADLIDDPKESPDDRRRPFLLSAQNRSDQDRGKILITHGAFPDELFVWISCAIKYTATHRHPKVPLPPNLLVELERATQQGPQDRISATEGRRLLRLHKSIERKGKLVKQRKALVLAETADLMCEVCFFSFHDAYGDHGIGFAECHHIEPLAEITGETLTSLDDLSIVCANCHRMLHRRPFPTLDNLRQMIERARIKKGCSDYPSEPSGY